MRCPTFIYSPHVGKKVYICLGDIMKKIERERIEISSLDEIKLLVDTFYGKVRNDDLIGPIFDEVIQDRWPVHLRKMYSFWQTVLLGKHTYEGAPFPPHVKLPINETHFQRWIGIFNHTVDELFYGEIAEEAKWRADKMAKMFTHKLDYYRQHNLKPLV